MDSQVLHVMTISNSIIGVSLLAMPYCFKQCGIILSILILILSSILSRLSCHLLLKSAILARRKTFEVLAFHTFGSLGKFMTEIGIIGFLIGTCIAFFVIMGDLGPTIITKMIGTNSTDTLRTSILMALALFCVLPLGLLRNVDSLSSFCTATIGFYFCLVLKIISEAVPHLFSGDWFDKVELWRPSGILQCLPIFSMALSCQTQIFEIYQVVQNASLEKMNNLIRVAINICTCVYIFVGTFGYIAFCNQSFTGNILMSFSSSLVSDAIKIGFVLSVAFSFPLVIFPCRASVYSLLYKQAYSLHEGTDKYIPEGRFKAITFVIIFISLVIGILIPNIEVVLGLMGSTIGIMICVIFPAICFICVSTKNTNERMMAQIMLFSGVLIMVLGTYANLFTTEVRSTVIPTLEAVKLDQNVLKVIDIPLETDHPDVLNNVKPQAEVVTKISDMPIQNKIENNVVRHEPPQPQPPSDSNTAEKKAEIQSIVLKDDNKVAKQDNNIESNKIKSDNLPDAEGIKQNLESLSKNKDIKAEVQPKDIVSENKKAENVVIPPLKVPENKLLKSEEIPKDKIEIIDDKKPLNVEPLQQMEVHHEPPQPVEPLDAKIELAQPKQSDSENKSPLNTNIKIPLEIPNSVNNKQDEQVILGPESKAPVIQAAVKREDSEKQNVDIEAIKKEDKELLEQEKELTEEEKKNLELLKTLEKQNKEQQKLVEESKKVLEEIKQRQHFLEEKKQKVIMEKEKQIQLKKDENNNVVPNNNVKLNKGNFLPLPIVLSNSLNKKNSSINDKIINVNVPVKPEKLDNIPIQPSGRPSLYPAQSEQHHNVENEIPGLHREIRSVHDDANKVCETTKKSVVTEDPVIKMNMKLTNSEIVIKDTINVSDKIIAGDVKPLTRDLKSYNQINKEE